MSVRRGIEHFTGAYHPVIWNQKRADAGMPPWESELDGQFFLDSEVEERGERSRPEQERG